MRIDLRGENNLNSKAEYSRCRVPRLKVDMEGWKKKGDKEKAVTEEAERLTNPEIEEVPQPLEVAGEDEILI